MQVHINEFRKYLVVAGTGNSLNRYVVKGDQMATMFAKFDRVVYIGEIECFECYLKDPESGQTGWEIVFIEGVKEKIGRLYPYFDCFITQGYPTKGTPVVEFYHYDNDDYDLSIL